MRKPKESKHSSFSWQYASKTLESLFPAMMDSFDTLFDDVGEYDPTVERIQSAEANTSIATEA